MRRSISDTTGHSWEHAQNNKSAFAEKLKLCYIDETDSSSDDDSSYATSFASIPALDEHNSTQAAQDESTISNKQAESNTNGGRIHPLIKTKARKFQTTGSLHRHISTRVDLPTIIERLNGVEKPIVGSQFKTYNGRLMEQVSLGIKEARREAEIKVLFDNSHRPKSQLTQNLGIPFPLRISQPFMDRLSLSHSKIVIQDFKAQCKLYNGILMSLLMERDQLCMEQNSIIEDINDILILISTRLRISIR